MSTLTVSQLNRQIRTWLEKDIGEVSVVGELSGISKPASGHYYFTLKDQTAQIRCVFFRNYHQPDSKLFKDGQQAIVRGKPSLYEARGDYQLIVQELTAYGLGELYRQFELLKNKLEQQGLFAAHRKKVLPEFPGNIAVITSSSGAALHDILTTLSRRYPLAAIYIYASEVQGKGAAPQLIQALKQANADHHCDVILLARGGGSIEDLWAFNDEQLARAISESRLPVVTGIGHETDFTIADFVADYRAATPTAAAEAVTPDQYELLKLIQTFITRLIRAAGHMMQQRQMKLSHQIIKIASPEHLIYKYWQTLDHLQRQLKQTLQQRIHRQQHRLHLACTHLQARHPVTLLHRSLSLAQQYEQRLVHAINERLEKLRQRLTNQLATLHAVSPLATLDRGYAIATHHSKIVFNSRQVEAGDRIELKLSRGELTCEVLDSKAPDRTTRPGKLNHARGTQ
ncbi:exodeoxyribonuclease VII large subunit [Legionella spiritensis]|uniref:exodeoxyribonuclease VII large subunit n=1 Tax=Legionella spiritensis TaxID=452 RepID=UPI000F6DD4B0|nr:exodeoxyribonuclease VII large subunit [Legionella spiritensis]VEG89698.1 exonuclease VII large subunit [Legionella spiritensis]